MKAEHQLAVALAEAVLELVAVAPALDRGLDRLELESLEAAEPGQRVFDLLLLLGELALVFEALPRRAGAGLAAVVAAIRDPLGARLEQLGRRAPRRSCASAWSPRRARGRRAAPPATKTT